MPTRFFLIPAVLLVSTGCQGWPTWSQKGPGVRIVDPDDPSNNAIEVNWLDVSENEADGANDFPTTTQQRLTLGEFDAVVITGELEGAGWLNTQEPRELGESGCASGNRTPPTDDGGDYVFDVDSFRLDVEAAATLCVAIHMTVEGGDADDTYGYDAVLHEVDDCGVPVGAADPDTLPGFNLGYQSPRPWAIQVDGGAHAMVLGAYYPIDADVVGTYELAIAALPADAATLCPTPPFSEES